PMIKGMNKRYQLIVKFERPLKEATPEDPELKEFSKKSASASLLEAGAENQEKPKDDIPY
ncbi:MAG: hypothetical protein AAGG75_18200, partial [Bacteroidota bacterium]